MKLQLAALYIYMKEKMQTEIAESVMREWKVRDIRLRVGGRPLVMGILNVTPDSFSDGDRFASVDAAVRYAEQMVNEGASIIDVGGESTRPGAAAVSIDEELCRVLPVIERLVMTVGVPVSVDTTKREVARAALEAGAHIVNDISGLRFEPGLADEVARYEAGLVVMHSRGSRATLHSLPPVEDVLTDVAGGLRMSIDEATQRGVMRESIAVDPGIGFGKSFEQNLELLAKLEMLTSEFSDFPLLVGTSRKGFIGKLLDDAPVSERLHGTMATIAVAVLRGASVVRVHDVRAAVETVRIVDAIRRAGV